MATSNVMDDRIQARIGRPYSTSWGIPMSVGVLLIVAGIFALFALGLTSLVSAVFLGVLLMTVGALEIVSSFRARHTGPFVAYFLGGLLSIIVGGLFLYRPLASLTSLTLLIAGFLFTTGVFQGITAIVDRYPRWSWDLAYGLVSIALGVIVIARWPFSTLWVVGTVVAIEIIARGAALIAASWAMRELDGGGLAAT